MGRKHALEDVEEAELRKKTKVTKPQGIAEIQNLKNLSTTTTLATVTIASATTPTGSNSKIDEETRRKVTDQPVSAHHTQVSTQVPNVAVPQSEIISANQAQDMATGEAEVASILPDHLAHLLPKYSFATMSIKSHSKINKKVTSMIGHMSRFNFMDPNIKPGIVVLDARSSDANKMITVIEIAKKNIFENNRSGKWYQYNKVGSEMTQISRKTSKKESVAVKALAPRSDGGAMDVDHVESGMRGKDFPDSKDTKLRAIPTLTIYMSRVPVPELRAEFGEQSNEQDIVKWWEPFLMARA